MQPNNPNNPNEQLVNNPPQQPMLNQNQSINQPVQSTNSLPNFPNQPQDVAQQQPALNQNVNIAQQPQSQPQAPAVNLNNQPITQTPTTTPSYSSPSQVNSSQSNQQNNQLYLNNIVNKPSFGVVALILLQVMYTIFSLMYMVNLFSDSKSLNNLKVMLFILFILTTIGYAFLLFKIVLKKYWALMVYVGAMAITTTVEIKDVVAYNNIEWSYIASLIFAFSLFGLSVYLATAKKNHFN